MPPYKLDIPNFAQCEHIGFVPSQRIFFFRQGRHLQKHGTSIFRTRKERGNQWKSGGTYAWADRFLSGSCELSSPEYLRFMLIAMNEKKMMKWGGSVIFLNSI